MKILLLSFSAALAISAAQPRWVATWATSPGGPATNLRTFKNQTIREIVHVSLGGNAVRARISNVYGTTSIVIGGAHVALRGNGSSIIPESDRTLKFGGLATVTIPPGAQVVSDPSSLNVRANSDLAVSIFLPNETPAETMHRAAFQTSYVSEGDVTAKPELSFAAETITSWPFLAGVDVARSSQAEAIVAFGDSITDGSGSTRDANHRWPDYLLARLAAKKHEMAVLNAGIGGNRVVYNGAGPLAYAGPSLRTRFDHDVLAQPGVKFVIVLAGINDIGVPGTSFAPISEEVPPVEIVASLRQVAERAHEHGLRVFVGTLTPFEGSTIKGYFTGERELRRQEVNTLIRSGEGFDGMIDFDKVIADPSHPRRILPGYDSGDHLHLNDAGYQAMAAAIDLSLFTRKQQ
jgi:lysophospholipase L1-like esterase